MKPSQVASILKYIASNIQASKKPDRALVARNLKQVLAALNSNITFHGTLRSEFDGENTEGEGQITINKIPYKISLQGTGRDSFYEINGEPVENIVLKEQLDEFFSENWPESNDPTWELHTENDREFMTTTVKFS